MLSLKEINAQINDLLKAGIQSEGVINLFDSKTAGEKFNLFDPDVLEEIAKMKEKNIAGEILRKLMAEQVSAFKRMNVVQSQKFSGKITRLMNACYNGLLPTRRSSRSCWRPPKSRRCISRERRWGYPRRRWRSMAR